MRTQYTVYYCVLLHMSCLFFIFHDTATPESYTYCHTLSLHDPRPISPTWLSIRSCSKLSHCHTFARANASPGRYGVPSARKHRIAFDSASTRPSSSSITGTVPAGLLRKIGRAHV